MVIGVLCCCFLVYGKAAIRLVIVILGEKGLLVVLISGGRGRHVGSMIGWWESGPGRAVLNRDAIGMQMRWQKGVAWRSDCGTMRGDGNELI